jgi:dipeptidyl aminopeptidase/acylaminoacyl peptidase
MTEQATATRFTVEDFVNIEMAVGPSFSADGQSLAFRCNRTGVMQAWLVAAGGGEPRQLTDTDGVIYGVRFRPGHDEVLYIADVGGDEQYQLHLIDARGGATRVLRSEPRVIHNFGAWSEDGRLLSYACNRRDQRFFDLYVLDADSGDERLVYQQDGMNVAGRISPDARSMLFSRFNHDRAGDNDLYLLDLESGEARCLTEHEGIATFTQAQFHPARTVLLRSDEEREFAGLQRVDLVTGAREFLLEPAWDIEHAALSDDGARLAVVTNEDGYSRLALYDVTSEAGIGERLPAPDLPDGVISMLSWRPDGGALAFVFEGPRHLSDVWTFELANAAFTQVTRSDMHGIPAQALPEPELIHYPTFDGREVPAFFYRPAGGPNAGPLPCMVLVHGGPEGQSRPGLWGRDAAPVYLMARGDLALLVPNVRGSTGYGKQYSHLDDVERRMDSVRDLIAALDWLAGRPDIDVSRVGVMGGSYGGFMALAAVTEAPERWAAAVDLFGISNFETFMRHTGPWRMRHRAAEYGDPERDAELLREISPIHRVDRISAPLMVVQGDRDTRVPMEESDQMVEAIRRKGGTIEYLVFEDEGHGIAKLPHKLEMARAIVAFLEQHLIGGRSSSPKARTAPGT